MLMHGYSFCSTCFISGNRRKTALIMYILTVTFFISITVINSEIIYRPSIGVTFEPQHFSVTPVEDKATLQFAVHLPINDFDFNNLLLDTSSEQLFSKLSNFDKLDSTYQIVSTLLLTRDVAIDKVKFLRENLIKELKDEQAPHKRAPLSIGGSFLSFLFGVSTEDDVAELDEKDKELEAAIEQLRHISSDQAKILKESILETDNQFKSVRTYIDGNRNKISELSIVVNNISDTLEVYASTISKELQTIHKQNTLRNYLHNLATTLNNDLIVLESYIKTYENYLIAIEKLKEGYITPTLISITALEKALNSVFISIQEQRSELEIGLTNVLDVYKLPTANFLLSGNDLFINMYIPLSITANPFRVYKLNSFPMVVHGSTDLSYQTLTNNLDYIIVDSSNRFLIPITFDNLMTCALSPGGLCPNLRHFTINNLQSCEVALFLGINEMVTSLCQFEIFMNKLPSFTRRVGDNKFLISNPKAPVELICPQGPETINDVSYTTIAVPCECYLRIGTFQTETIRCNNIDLKFQKQYPVNIPFLKEFNLTKFIPDADLDFESETSLVYNMPKLPKVIDNLKMENDGDASKTSLRELAELINTDIPELNVNDYPYLFSNFYSSSSFYPFLAIAISTVLQYIGMAYLIYKNKLFSVALLQRPSHALVLRAFTTTAAPVAKVKYLLNPSISEFIKHVCIIAITILIVFFIFQLIKINRERIHSLKESFPFFFTPSNACQHIRLYVKVSNSKDTIILYVNRFPFTYGSTIISSAPSNFVASLTYSFFIVKLFLSHDDELTFKEDDIIRHYELPKYLCINPFRYRHLSSILNSEDVSIRLMYRSHTNERLMDLHNQVHTDNDNLIMDSPIPANRTSLTENASTTITA